MNRLLVALAAFATACAVSSSDEPVQKSTAPIINGSNSPSGAPEDAVVLLVINDGQSQGACSGSLIAQNLVLTARHCVSHVSDQGFACDVKGNLLGGGGTQIGADHDPSTIGVYYGNQRPGFGDSPLAKGVKIFHPEAKTLCNTDIALVLLDVSIDGEIAKIRLDSPPVNNETFTAVGWGVAVGDPYPNIRQHRPKVPIKHVGPYEGSFEAVPPNEFQIGEAICSGDSGGPVMATSTNAILGVVSRGGNGTSSPTDPAAGCMNGSNFYTRVDSFRDLILGAFAEAGADPWLEGGPDPRLGKIGAKCGGDAECRSNICLTGKSVCSQDCSTDACPAGYQCGTDSGRTACIPVVSSGGGCRTSGDGETGGGVALALAAVVVVSARRRRKSV